MEYHTHGFAMLNRLRTIFPASRSMLMDRDTLLAHRALWVHEEVPFRGQLSKLESDERDLYQALVENTCGERVRLEQERVSYSRVREALHDIAFVA